MTIVMFIYFSPEVMLKYGTPCDAYLNESMSD